MLVGLMVLSPASELFFIGLLDSVAHGGRRCLNYTCVLITTRLHQLTPPRRPHNLPHTLNPIPLNLPPRHPTPPNHHRYDNITYLLPSHQHPLLQPPHHRNPSNLPPTLTLLPLPSRPSNRRRRLRNHRTPPHPAPPQQQRRKRRKNKRNLRCAV